jgi:hypothetical protein
LRQQSEPVQQFQFVVLVLLGVQPAAANAESVEFIQQFEFRADSRAAAAAIPQLVQFVQFVQQRVTEPEQRGGRAEPVPGGPAGKRRRGEFRG